ncbi:MAG: hypothetical protein IJT03_02640 [Clostridia bacterium]|nr:hypothetical protein [Clostridia bacterium]
MKKDDLIEIDVVKLLLAIWHNIIIVILVAAVFAVATAGFTYAFIEPTYDASTMIYVNNNNKYSSDQDSSISSSALTAAQELVNTYIVILQSRTTISEIIEYANLDMNYADLKKMITATPVNSTEFFEVTVRTKNPADSEKIANAIAHVLPEQITETVEGSSVKVVDYAVKPTSRSGPNYIKNSLVGAFLGMLISMIFIVVRELFNVFIVEEQYLTKNYKYPVLSVIPDMREGSRRGSYYYSSYNSPYSQYYSYATPKAEQDKQDKKDNKDKK